MEHNCYVGEWLDYENTGLVTYDDLKEKVKNNNETFEFDGTLFTYINNNTINQNEFFVGKSIENIIKEKEKTIEILNVIFWIIWSILIGAVDFVYVCLENNYLED